MSRELHPLYVLKAHNLTNTIVNGDGTDASQLQPLARKAADICNKLKQTNTKNNIMKEARDIFYDKKFLKKSMEILICCASIMEYMTLKKECFVKADRKTIAASGTKIDYHPVEHWEKKMPGVIQQLNSLLRCSFL